MYPTCASAGLARLADKYLGSLLLTGFGVSCFTEDRRLFLCNPNLLRRRHAMLTRRLFYEVAALTTRSGSTKIPCTILFPISSSYGELGTKSWDSNMGVTRLALPSEAQAFLEITPEVQLENN